jgi:hypothetical protein
MGLETEAAAPEPKRSRRIGALVVLGVGALLVSRLIDNAWPQEQTVIFRLPRDLAEVATRFEASFTSVGEPTPARGFTLTLSPPSSRDLRQTVTLPEGDYIVAQEVTYPDSTSATGPSAPKKSETSRPQRVTLSGDETLIVFVSEGPE